MLKKRFAAETVRLFTVGSRVLPMMIHEENTYTGENTWRRKLLEGRTLGGEPFLRGEQFEKKTFSGGTP